MINLGVGRDATVLFESYHSVANVPGKLLEKLRVGEMAEPSPLGEAYDWEDPFWLDLKSSVRKYFTTTKLPRRGNPGLYFKTLVIMSGWLFGFYWGYVLGSVLGAFFLGFCSASIG